MTSAQEKPKLRSRKCCEASTVQRAVIDPPGSVDKNIDGLWGPLVVWSVIQAFSLFVILLAATATGHSEFRVLAVLPALGLQASLAVGVWLRAQRAAAQAAAALGALTGSASSFEPTLASSPALDGHDDGESSSASASDSTGSGTDQSSDDGSWPSTTQDAIEWRPVCAMNEDILFGLTVAQEAGDRRAVRAMNDDLSLSVPGVKAWLAHF